MPLCLTDTALTRVVGDLHTAKSSPQVGPLFLDLSEALGLADPTFALASETPHSPSVLQPLLLLPWPSLFVSHPLLMLLLRLVSTGQVLGLGPSHHCHHQDPTDLPVPELSIPIPPAQGPPNTGLGRDTQSSKSQRASLQARA